MGQSGTKLVLILAGLALTAGVTSWLYRYEAAHQATTFWGVEAARLIAQPAEAEVFVLTVPGAEGIAEEGVELLDLGRKYQPGEAKGLTNARGMVHLRHALMSDGSYEWDAPVDPATVDWGWCLRFFDGEREVLVVLSEDLAVIGQVVVGGQTAVEAYSCRPLTESLQVYFTDLSLLDASTEE